MYLRALFACTLLAMPFGLAAQTDSLPGAQVDTHAVLPLVEVHGESLHERPAGVRQQKWTTAQLEKDPNPDLGVFLSEHGGVFIKSYGSGSIATSSIRGGSASQTAVFWNGLPIQSPMLGQSDLSLLSPSSFDELSLSYGGQSASRGSGAIGGVIALDNHLKPHDGLSLYARGIFGSFDQAEGTLKASYGNGRFGGETRILYQSSENDFTYRVRPDLPTQRQQHAARRQSGLMQALHGQK